MKCIFFLLVTRGVQTSAFTSYRSLVISDVGFHSSGLDVSKSFYCIKKNTQMVLISYLISVSDDVTMDKRGELMKNILIT